MKFRSAGTVYTLEEHARREVGSSDVAVELRESQIKPASKRLAEFAANRLTLQLQEVGRRRENWDRRGSAAPKADSVSRAISIVDRLIAQATATGPTWRDPMVGLDENGDVSLEWWCGERKLTLYIAPDATEYVRSWGPHIDNEMELDVLQRDGFQQLWRWLNKQ